MVIDGVSAIGLTVKTKVSVIIPPLGMLAVTVIVPVPNPLAAGLIVKVRVAPEPLMTIPVGLFGTSVVLSELAATVVGAPPMLKVN